MTKEQDRARERRRWEKREKKLAERRAQSLRDRQAVLAVVGVLVVVIGFVLLANFLTNRSSDATPEATPTTAAPTEEATTSSTPTPTPSVLAGCTTPPPVASAPKPVTGQPNLDATKGKTLVATITTNCGVITAELDGKDAPAAVSSFAFLASQGYWAPSPCHRLVTTGIYVLQCGDPTGTGSGPGPGYHFGVENVPGNDVYQRGVLAMARKSGDPNSNADQFFIVTKDTTLPKSGDGSGYTVFGRVTSGLDILDKIAAAGSTPEGDGAPLGKISILNVETKPKA